MRKSKKTAYLIFVSIILVYLLTNSLNAQTTEEATSSAISQQEVKEKIKQRLEDTIDEEKIEQVKGTIEKKLQNKAFAYAGILKSIDDDFLTLETNQGDKKVEVATDSAIISVLPGKSKKNIQLKEAEIGQFTIAIGFMNEDKIINAKKVIFSTASTALKRKVIWGKVIEVDVDKDRLKIKDNGQERNFVITPTANLKIKGVAKPKVADIQLEDKVIAVLQIDKEEKVKACKAIFVIPGKYNPEAEENAINATPSAQPSPSE